MEKGEHSTDSQIRPLAVEVTKHALAARFYLSGALFYFILTRVVSNSCNRIFHD